MNRKWNTTGKIDHKIDDNSEAEGGTILRYDTVINIVVMFLRSLNMLISPDCCEVWLLVIIAAVGWSIDCCNMVFKG